MEGLRKELRAVDKELHKLEYVDGLVDLPPTERPALSRHERFPAPKKKPNLSFVHTNAAFGVKGFTFSKATTTQTQSEHTKSNTILSPKFKAPSPERPQSTCHTDELRPQSRARGRMLTSFNVDHYKAGWAAGLHKSFALPKGWSEQDE